MENNLLRYDWQIAEVQSYFEQPFMELLYTAHTVHRRHFDPNRIQCAKLFNIKTGACPEDCGYCSQSGHYKTGLQREKLLPLADVVRAAEQAQREGATRFCLGAAWRGPQEKDLESVIAMIQSVKAMGMETCVTLGMLTEAQANRLADAGLDFYNHNLDTSPEHYPQITTTRTYQDRLDTLQHVRDSGVKVCCGGILGLGETRRDRASLLRTLANLQPHPESVPINKLIPMPGTPLHNAAPVDPFEIVRTIAVARILMPKSVVRLTAGRTSMNDELQALCFFAGANSIFLGDKLLTAKNPELDDDQALLQRLGIQPEALVAESAI